MKRRILSMITAIAMCIGLQTSVLAAEDGPAAVPTSAVSTAGVSQTAFAACGDIGRHWTEDTIVRWVNEGYIYGYSNSMFRLNQPISRAAFVALANRAFGFSSSAEISFQDVPPSYWAYEEIQKGVAAGYVCGDDTGMFRPDDAVTRQEAAVMLAKINHLPIVSNLSLLGGYAYGASIADWAKPCVGAAAKAGVMIGFPNGPFGPGAFMTRAEVVAALDRAASTYENHETADYILTETTLRDMVVEGDLILPSSLGGESILLDNVTVNGTVRIRGGGTVNVQSCDLSAVELDKSGVVFSSDSDTSVSRLEFLQKGTIKGQGYDSVVIADDGVTEAVIGAAVETVQLSTDANVKLLKVASVSTLNITEDGDDGKITLSRGSSVDDMNVHGKVRITGQGDISNMTVYVPGITSSVKPDSVELKEDGKTPSYTGGGSSGGGSSFSGGSSSSGGSSFSGGSSSSGGGSSSGGDSSGGDSSGGDSSGGDDPADDNETQPVLDSIQPSAVSVKAGENITLTAGVTGDMTGYCIHWTVNNTAVAVLSPSTGNTVSLTGKAEGSATVTAELRNSDGEAVSGRTISVSVAPKAQVTAITLAPQQDSYKVSETITATAALSAPLGDGGVSWTSSDNSYVTVTPDSGDSSRAVIEIINADTTAKTVTISAQAEGQASAVEKQIVIKELIPVTNISGIPASAALNTVLTLTGTVEPADATKQNIAWEIIDAGETGVVLDGNRLTGAAKAGTVTVRATIEGGTPEGAYTQDFQIPLGPRIVSVSADKETAVKGDAVNVTVVIEYPENGYRIRWNATSSAITPTYDAMYQSTNQYRATATIVFPNMNEPFGITANIVDSQSDSAIDSESVFIPGIATIDYMTINNFQYTTEVKQGTENTLRIVTDWSGTFRWSIESAVEGVTLSGTEGESTTLTVADDVAVGTVITVNVSVDGNPNGGFEKSYTVVAGN